MIFKRKKKLPALIKLKQLFLPQKGWRRVIEYFLHRLRRLPDTPHKIALGLACGIFISFLPIFGLHFFLAAILAHIIKGNVLASLIGTFFGNPITFPFIATFSVNVGQRLLNQRLSDSEKLIDGFILASDAMWDSVTAILGFGQSQWYLVFKFGSEVFFPYLLGGILLGPLVAIPSYFIFRPFIFAYQVRRRKKKLRKLRIKKKFAN